MQCYEAMKYERCYIRFVKYYAARKWIKSPDKYILQINSTKAFSINDGAMQFHQYRCWSSPSVDIKPQASAHMEDKSGNKMDPR
jgi:hypothetical protein